MTLAKRIKNAVAAFKQTADMNEDTLLEWLGVDRADKRAIAHITYFTCLKMLSETLGKMPVKMYCKTDEGLVKITNHEAYRLLSDRPNPYMTPTTFWTTLENNRNHHGNAYAYIEREFMRNKYGGSVKIKALWIMPSEDVSVLVDDAGIFKSKGKVYYQYSDHHSGEMFVYNQEDVLHFKTWLSFDGISGEPVRRILKSTIDGGLENQSYTNNLYKQGLTASMVLQYTGDLEDKAVNRLRQKFSEMGSGSRNAGKVIPIPFGMTLTPLNLKLTDSQFYELRKYSALQIAGAFGIKPNQINDYEKSSYANSESQQLSFLIDTGLYNLKGYEEELNYKLLTAKEAAEGFFLKFNEKVLLRTDMKTQSETLKNLVLGSVYTPNEAREFLDKPKDAYGDRLIANGNIIPLEKIGEQYTREKKVERGEEKAGGGEKENEI